MSERQTLARAQLSPSGMGTVQRALEKRNGLTAFTPPLIYQKFIKVDPNSLTEFFEMFISLSELNTIYQNK